MVAVENATGTLQVEVVFGIFAPGQAYELFEIVDLYAVFRTLSIEHIEFVKLFFEEFGNLIGPFLVLGFLFQFTLLSGATVRAELFADILHLLLQEILLLLLVKILVCLLPDLVFQFIELDVAVLQFQQFHESL